MKRSRQRLRSCVVDGSDRNCRHLVTMTAWITSTAAVQAPATTAPVQRLDRKPTVRDQQQHHERGRQPVLGELPQQLVVEGDAGAGGGGEPLAGLADPLGGEPPALGERLLARHRNVALFCYAHWTLLTRNYHRKTG